MENDGLPNAGLYDQRAALQWIQDFIGLVGGDKSQVSAWGESAGAGSILHHLTAFGGTQDPLFSRAVLESPAYEFMFDRKGSLEQTFQNFAALAGCAGQGVSCLRAADTKVLSDANIALSEAATDGASPVGPSADGKFVRQLAPLELASGECLLTHLVSCGGSTSWFRVPLELYECRLDSGTYLLLLYLRLVFKGRLSL